MAALSRARFVAATASALATINIVRAPAGAAQFQYKFGTSVPIDDPRNTNAVVMWNAVREQTGGRLDVKLFPDNILGSDTAMLTQTRSGALEFQAISGSILSNVVPVTQIANVPFAWKNADVAYRAFDGALGDYVRKDIAARGLVPMPGILDNGFRQVTTANRPIQTVDDFNGLKIRTANGKLVVDLFKTLGATPTPMGTNELYTALQTHIVDGQENAYHIVETQRYYEVQKYLSVTNHMWDGIWVIANGDAWKALGPDIQRVVTANMLLNARRQRRENNLLNGSLADKLQRQGLKFNTADVSTFKAKLVDFYPRWREEFGPQAWGLLQQYAGTIG